MKDKEINNTLKLFYESITSAFPNIDSKIRGVYVDLWEIYNDLVFEDEDIHLKKPAYPNQLIFDNTISLVTLTIKYCKEKDFDKLQTCLINLDIKLEHSQNHLKEARRSLKSIINQVGKILPDDKD